MALLLPAASASMILSTSKPTYESGQTVQLTLKLNGFEREEGVSVLIVGEHTDQPEDSKNSNTLFNINPEFTGSYFFNWTGKVDVLGTYNTEGIYVGQIKITATLYNSTTLNESNIIAQEFHTIIIEEPSDDSGDLLDFLPFDPLLLLGGLVGLVVLVGGGMITYRIFDDSGSALPPPPSSGSPPGGSLSSLGGLNIAGAKSGRDDEEEDQEGAPPDEKLAALGGESRKAAAGAAHRDDPRRKAKPRKGGKPSSGKPGARPKPQRPSRAKPRRPAARPKARPRPRGPPKSGSTGGPKPKPKGAPKPKGGPPKPKEQKFHCSTDGTELQHWPDSGYESDYFCPKCELYVKPKEQAGGGSSGGTGGAQGEKREVTCPGCHTVHEVTDPSVSRITCTCGRRIRV